MDRWNVGMDMIVYRDGQDSCGWHADDTQNERLVVAVVVECGSARRVCIRPNRKPSTGAKRAGPLEVGDEEIELKVGQGGESCQNVWRVRGHASSPTLRCQRCLRCALTRRPNLSLSSPAIISDAYDFDSPVHDGYEHSVPKGE